MHFGVMDHLDLSGDESPQEHYENRLKLVEICDQGGFYGYHVTEHHCTPLGGAASPSVFLAAATQRSRNIRLGTLVYALPLHHPIRLTEEIGMLDRMSGGRVDLGFGRGSVPMELGYFGVDPLKARDVHEEALACVLQGMATGRIDFHGEHYQITDAPIHQRPIQQPSPPIWYGVHSTESAELSGRRGYHIVCNEPVEASRTYIDQFRAAWSERNDKASDPMVGLARSVFVAPTNEEALAVARRAHLRFNASFRWLHNKHGVTPRLSGREATFDELIASDRGVAGDPDAVARELARQIKATGANYCVMRLAFGDMSGAEISRSAGLFVDEVIPRIHGAMQL